MGIKDTKSRVSLFLITALLIFIGNSNLAFPYGQWCGVQEDCINTGGGEICNSAGICARCETDSDCEYYQNCDPSANGGIGECSGSPPPPPPVLEWQDGSQWLVGTSMSIKVDATDGFELWYFYIHNSWFKLHFTEEDGWSGDEKCAINDVRGNMILEHNYYAGRLSDIMKPWPEWPGCMWDGGGGDYPAEIAYAYFGKLASTTSGDKWCDGNCNVLNKLVKIYQPIGDILVTGDTRFVLCNPYVWGNRGRVYTDVSTGNKWKCDAYGNFTLYSGPGISPGLCSELYEPCTQPSDCCDTDSFCGPFSGLCTPTDEKCAPPGDTRPTGEACGKCGIKQEICSDTGSTWEWQFFQCVNERECDKDAYSGGNYKCAGINMLWCNNNCMWQFEEDCSVTNGNHCVGLSYENQKYSCFGGGPNGATGCDVSEVVSSQDCSVASPRCVLGNTKYEEVAGTCTEGVGCGEAITTEVVCSTKLSTDTDSPTVNYGVAGTVTDYTTCNSNPAIQCNYIAYADACSGATYPQGLIEYSTNGASYSSTVYDCEAEETTYCSGSVSVRREWGCINGACRDDAVADTSVDCAASSGYLNEYTCSGQTVQRKFRTFSCNPGTGTCQSSDSWISQFSCGGGEDSRCVSGQSTCQNLCTNGINDDGDAFVDRNDPDCCAECKLVGAWDSNGGACGAPTYNIAWNSWSGPEQRHPWCCGDGAAEFLVTAGSFGAGCCGSASSCVDASGTCQSGTENCATNNIDEDCDGNCGYDRWGCPSFNRGDDNCPVSVDSISVSKSSTCTNENILVYCKPSVFGVDSIEATIGGRSCIFNSWTAAGEANFTCTTNSVSTTENARCFVNPAKSAVSGTDKTASITVSSGGSCCSQHSAPGACSGAAGCEWCASCQAFNKYSGSPIDRCVASGSCAASSACTAGQCAAACDASIGCPDQSQCVGKMNQTRIGANACQTGAGQLCNCDYSINPWVNEACRTADACGALCNNGQLQACITGLGYAGAQSCNAICEWSECTSTEFCGDGQVTGSEECDPNNNACPSPGMACNPDTCRIEPASQENIANNNCNDGLDNDCDGKVDGVDGKLTAAPGDTSVCPEGSGTAPSDPNRGCDDGFDNDDDGFADDDDSGCCDACNAPGLVFDLSGGPVSDALGEACSGTTLHANSWNSAYNRYPLCCGNDPGGNEVVKINSLGNSGCCHPNNCLDNSGYCQAGVENTISLCSNSLDDDCDGNPDWQDSDCFGGVSGTVFDGDKLAQGFSGFVIDDVEITANPPLGPPPGYTVKSDLSGPFGYYEIAGLYFGTYTLRTRKANYGDEVATVTVGPGLAEQDFSIYKGDTCNSDCTNSEGVCIALCNGNNGCTTVHPKCNQKIKGFKANYAEAGIYYDVTCCTGPVNSYPAIQANVSGSAKSLYDHVSPVKIGGRIFRMHILVWTPWKG